MKLTLYHPRVRDILFINPDHQGGTYAMPFRSGVTFLASTPNVADMHYQTNEFDIKAASSSAIFTGFTYFFRHIFSDTYWETPLTWLEGKPSMKEVDIPVSFSYIWDKVYCPKDWAGLLEKYFNVRVQRIEGSPLITISKECNGTLRDTLMELYTLSMLLSIHADEYLNEDQIRKMVEHMPRLPYFITYLLSHRVITSASLFDELKPVLEEKCTEAVNLVQGNTHDLRIKWVRKNLIDGDVLDFGCGDWQHAKSRGLNGITWLGYDIEDYSKAIPRLKRDYGVNAKFLTKEEMWASRPRQVVCSEVLEHLTRMDIDDTLYMLAKKKAGQYLFTTVDVDFNVHYGVESRREDHITEMNKKEFQAIIKNAFSFKNTNKFYFITFGQIGDTIDGNTPSQTAKVQSLKTWLIEGFIDSFKTVLGISPPRWLRRTLVKYSWKTLPKRHRSTKRRG